MTEPLVTETPDIAIDAFVKADAATVWDALTRPDAITAHHYGGLRAEPLPGGGHRLLDGAGETFIAEPLIAAEDRARLVLGFEPRWADSGSPASRVVFALSEDRGVTKIAFQHFGCAAFGIGDNWARFLAALKTWVETGERLTEPKAAA